ncbi:uncharacterized protein [Drosophila bipectinata]|uniref:uncharacterized protein n=1 Tax=Drosophila bipectinata TaxID=42026 RepID=UPI001C8AACB4|nr:uncharacterized protein LOC108126592 [Drosophila bipectinata]
MSSVEVEKHLKSPQEGAGSPGGAAAVAIKEDANETERLVKLITGMGYPEGEARLALAHSNNNVQRAIQILVEGHGDEEDAATRSHRRSRRRIRELRSSLLGNPATTDYVINQLMTQQSNVRALTEMLNGGSVEAMKLLLAEEDEGKEEEQLGRALETESQEDSNGEEEEDGEEEEEVEE